MKKAEYHRQSCPHCGHRQPFLKRLWGRSGIDSKWPCDFCGQKLGIDKGRRFLLGFLTLCLFTGIERILNSDLHSPWIINEIALIVLGLMVIWSFDRVKNKNDELEGEQDTSTPGGAD